MHKNPLVFDPMNFRGNSPIERKVATGPIPKKDEKDDVQSDYSGEIQKQEEIPLKKPPKELAITREGKIHIINQIDTKKEALCVKYNENFEYVAVGNNDGIIRAYNSTTGKEAFKLFDDEVNNKRSPVTSLQHRPVSKMYPVTNCFTGTYANGLVKCWNYNLHQCLYTIKEKRQTYGIVYHPRVPKFLTFGDDCKICFYDEESKTMERVLAPSENPLTHDGHMSRVFAACFHPRNNYEFLTGGWDDLIHFWDLRQPHAVRHLSGIHMCGEGLDINPKGTEVLTCAFQKEEAIMLFDYGSGKKIQTIEPDIYPSRLYCGKFANKDFIMCGGTDLNIFRVVDLQSITTIANINNLPGGIYGMDLGPVPKKKVEKTKEVTGRPKSDVNQLPKVVFVAAKKIYQVECF